MKQTGREKDTELESILHGVEEASARPVLTVDYELYAHFLEDSDLTEEQKREFLQAIWNIIVEFVSLGFGVHPVQQAQNACGKLEEDGAKPAIQEQDGIKCSSNVLSNEFESAAGPNAD